MKQNRESTFEFCKGIVDASAPYACGFKPQIAYFASQGAEEQLSQLCAYIHETYPHLPIVLDAKRGDIGTTAEHYAREAYERYKADAVTVSHIWDSTPLSHTWHGKTGALLFCAAPPIRVAQTCNLLSLPAGSRYICMWQVWSQKNGTHTASAVWWSAPPSLKS
ncbi:orotidine 5'-phosphate decarboxylase [Advenella kashmirensis WT001]|uniref:Orotidine 5'-phosphate decarboxylase n=1 Tax=Advenella kashmirensis (strain DSM 17095 / LMG 22695 / WT001) TaxID=1036672 RepID=I3UFK7_ADVKW|nr:orotidine 5'-phosphate decarboxylase [Advenella kashmirensis WT001]